MHLTQKAHFAMIMEGKQGEFKAKVVAHEAHRRYRQIQN